MPTTVPSMTFNAPGHVRAAGTLAAGASANYDLDYSSVIEGQVTVKITPGSSISSTRGVRVDFFPRYGTGPATTTIAQISYTMPSQTASTAESRTFYVSTGRWNVAITNLDTTNAVTAEISDDTVNGMG